MNKLIDYKARLAKIHSLDYIEVFKRFIPELKQYGSTYKCKSPFKPQEKTPSFNVNPTKQIWKCFSTQNGGVDIVSYIQKKNQLAFIQALEYVESYLGITKSASVDVMQNVIANMNRKYNFKNINGAIKLKYVYEDKMVEFMHRFVKTCKNTQKYVVWNVIQYVYDCFDSCDFKNNDDFTNFMKCAYHLLLTFRVDTQKLIFEDI